MGRISREAVDERDPNRMKSSRTTWLPILPAALLFLPLLAWPGGPDQSIYLVAGKILAEGGVYYRDVADVKPPAVPFLFAAAQAIFGEGILWVRLLEYVLQLSILFLLSYSLRRIGESPRTVFAVASIYALLYMSLGPDGTPQPESFVGLLLLPMMFLQVRRRTRGGALSLGLLGGILFLLKFSFAAVIAGAILAEFVLFNADGLRRKIERSLLLTASGGGVILLFFLLLSLTDTFSGWELMSGWIRGRLLHSLAGETPVSLVLRQTGFYLGYGFTITMLVGTIIAVIGTFRRGEDASGREKSEPVIQWRRLGAIHFFFLFASALVELMFVPYQFSRVFIPAALLTGPLAVGVWNRRRELAQGAYGYGMLTLLLGLALLFSPLPKYLSEVWRGLSWRFSESVSPGDSFNRNADPRWEEVVAIADTIRARSTGDREVYAVSDIAAFFYEELHTTPSFGILHGHYLIASFTPEGLEEEFMGYLREKRPEFLILEREDAGAAGIVGAASTVDALDGIPGFKGLLAERYDELLRTEFFLLYQRR